MVNEYLAVLSDTAWPRVKTTLLMDDESTTKVVQRILLRYNQLERYMDQIRKRITSFGSEAKTILSDPWEPLLRIKWIRLRRYCCFFYRIWWVMACTESKRRLFIVQRLSLRHELSTSNSQSGKKRLSFVFTGEIPQTRRATNGDCQRLYHVLVNQACTHFQNYPLHRGERNKQMLNRVHTLGSFRPSFVFDQGGTCNEHVLHILAECVNPA